MWLIITFLRLVIPLSILHFPLVGGFLSIVADGWDWKLLPLHTAKDYALYQNWDKLLDLYYLSLEALVVFFWKDARIKKVGLFLFVYRLVGTLLFELTNIRFLLFLFPNVFELYFLFIYIYMLLTHQTRIHFTKKQLTYILIGLTIPKLFQEYFFHVAEYVPWQIFDLRTLLHNSSFIIYYTDQFFWLVLFLILPVGLLWYLVKQQSQSRIRL